MISLYFYIPLPDIIVQYRLINKKYFRRDSSIYEVRLEGIESKRLFRNPTKPLQIPDLKTTLYLQIFTLRKP